MLPTLESLLFVLFIVTLASIAIIIIAFAWKLRRGFKFYNERDHWKG